MDTGAALASPSTVLYRVESSELTALGLRLGDRFRILEIGADKLFNCDLVAAYVKGFACIGYLHHFGPGLIKFTQPIVGPDGEPRLVRTAYIDHASILGLVIKTGPSAPYPDH